jgi:hypothetical protein
MGNRSNTQEQAADTKLVTGVTQYFVPANVSINLAGVNTTAATMEATIQSRIDATNATKTAKAALSKAAADRKATMVSTQPLVDAVTQIALIMYANQPAVLTVFGVNPRKVPAKLTTEQLAERAAKANATRAARGTMGPKAKAKVKGVVPSAAPAAGVAAPALTPAPGATPVAK